MWECCLSVMLQLTYLEGRRDQYQMSHHVEQPQKHLPQSERCLLAHDLNNSLNLVISRCEVLGDLISDNREAYKQLVLIQEAARHMAHRISESPCRLFGVFTLGSLSA